MRSWESWERMREIVFDETTARAFTTVMDRVKAQAPQLAPDDELARLTLAHAGKGKGLLLRVDMWIAQRLRGSLGQGSGHVLRCENCRTVISDDPEMIPLFMLVGDPCPNCGPLTLTTRASFVLELYATSPIERLRSILAHFAREADDLYRYGVALQSKHEWDALSTSDRSALELLSRIDGDSRARDVLEFLNGTKRYPQPVLNTDFPE